MNREKELRISVVVGFLAGIILLAGLAPATLSAQDMDSRWLPWLGCWEAVDGGEETPLICVRPAAQGEAVEFISWADDTMVSETILADGIPREAEREDCQGLEEAQFSDDGRRVYLKSDYVCEDGVRSRASGILAMVNPMEWVDIKAVEGTPWVLRYRLARASRVEEAGIENVVASRASAVKMARITASGRLTENDLIEASGKVDAVALEALIVERGDPFAVNADMLIRLADAGVPESVIDLAVAVSFPNRFAVKAGPGPVEEMRADPDLVPRRRMYMGVGFFDPYFGRMGYGYSPYYYGGYGYSSYYGGYYGGYGSGYYGGYGGYYRPSSVVIQPRTGGTMIKGRGYSRGGAGSGYTGGTARPRGSSGSSGGSSSAGRSAKPRGGGSASRSSGGSSSGARSAKPRSGGGSTVRSSGGSSAKVRTAKPRGGGGGLI